MKAKDFLTESQYQQYRMLFEMDPSRRDFLKKLGKGAAGVAGAAAMSAIPFSKAQASGNDKIQKFAMLAEKYLEKIAGVGMSIKRMTLTGQSISLSDSFDGAPKGNGSVTFKVTGVSRADGYNGEAVNGYLSILLKDYLVANVKFSGTPYPDINHKPKEGSMNQLFFKRNLE
jgi:hypothetical protein